MIEIHKSKDRGGFDHGWLDTKHSFSFDRYYNPERMNFGKLRVLNEDVIAPGEGFPTHMHNNMEIVTIVLDGVLEHRDSAGGHGLIKPGDVQRMSAGKGIRHSEFNASKEYPVHLLQIWIDTKEHNIQPGYEQKNFSWMSSEKMIKVVSGVKEPGPLYMYQKGAFYLGEIGKGKEFSQALSEKLAYVFLIEGKISVNGIELETGDAAAVTGESSVSIKTSRKSRILMMEFPEN